MKYPGERIFNTVGKTYQIIDNYHCQMYVLQSSCLESVPTLDIISKDNLTSQTLLGFKAHNPHSIVVKIIY